ncbi:MAG TPA: hypothetical protein P5244_03170 [Syntrophales bacterium]|nr:hypothetical protein [Syntrophales bacterium]HRT69987.1 hypothetical protein [Syntrophales bacterium]
MGWREFATKFHNQFADAMMLCEGRVLMKKEIIEMLLRRFPELREMEDWLYPSDHCKNHTNKGACYCAETNTAIFERLDRETYRVLKAIHLP